MEILIFLGGVILGFIFSKFSKRQEKTYGFIDVDHETGLCRVRITSGELSNHKTRKAMFRINHDANISREDQGL